MLRLESPSTTPDIQEQTERVYQRCDQYQSTEDVTQSTQRRKHEGRYEQATKLARLNDRQGRQTPMEVGIQTTCPSVSKTILYGQSPEHHSGEEGGRTIAMAGSSGESPRDRVAQLVAVMRETLRGKFRCELRNPSIDAGPLSSAASKQLRQGLSIVMNSPACFRLVPQFTACSRHRPREAIPRIKTKQALSNRALVGAYVLGSQRPHSYTASAYSKSYVGLREIVNELEETSMKSHTDVWGNNNKRKPPSSATRERAGSAPVDRNATRTLAFHKHTVTLMDLACITSGRPKMPR